MNDDVRAEVRADVSAEGISSFGSEGGVHTASRERSSSSSAAAARRENVLVFYGFIVEVRRTRIANIGPTASVLGGNARLAAHLGSGAPAAADLGSGARARGIAAPGEEAGAVGGVRSGRGAKGDRGREDRPVLGSREETSWAYHGVLSHDEHRLVHEHLRGHKRGDGDVADHSPASLGIHLAQDRGVHGHNRFRASHDGANAFSRLARSSATFCAGLPAEPRRRRRHNHGT